MIPQRRCICSDHPSGEEQWQSTMGKVAQWFNQPNGQQWLTQEQQLLTQALHDQGCFGRYLLHFGPQTAAVPAIWGGMQCIRIGPPAISGVMIQCGALAWPVAEHSVDGVILQHGLEFCSAPKRLLQEAAFGLRPGGHLLILGINPLSAWGVRCRFSKDVLNQAAWIWPSQVKTWLADLDFLTEDLIYSGRDGSFWSQYSIPLGGFYLIVARKLTPGIPPWRLESHTATSGALAPLAFTLKIPESNRG